MRIKRFEAPDTQKALAMVKQEMGEDAIILSTRSIPADKVPSGLKRNGKAWVEIVAAIDYDGDDQGLPGKSAAAAPDAGPLKKENKAPAAYDYRVMRAPGRNATAVVPPAEPTVRVLRQRQAKNENINFEAHDLRLRFSDLIKGKVPEIEEKKPSQLAKWRDELLDKIRLRSIEPGTPQKPVIIALVGPTGVGKTTTAAKLAAWYSLRRDAAVLLLSMDCYRIGATDQLRTYAQIMRLPCEVALRKKDLDRALGNHRDKELIIIDTAGKSPYDQQHVRELAEWFSPYREIEPFLVISASTKKEDLQQVFAAYESLALAGVIVSKLDETRAYATLCQQLAAANIPLAFLATGQSVPEDLFAASRNLVNSLFSKGWSVLTPEMKKNNEFD